MQIEQILFEYLSVLERIGRAKGNKGLSNSKIGGTGEYFMPRYRPKVGKETKEIAQIPFHNRKIYSILAKSSCAKLSRPGYLLRTDFSHFTLQGKSWASSLFKFNYQSRSTEVERQEAFGQHFTTSRQDCPISKFRIEKFLFQQKQICCS